MNDRLTVFGAGYVGLVSGVCLAADGRSVRILDVDPAKLEELRAGRCPFFEPGLDDLMRKSLDAGTLEFDLLSDVDRVDGIAMIAVGTPAMATGSADLSFVRSVTEFLAEHGDKGTTVVMKSTVPPGTGVRLAARLAEAGLGYVSNPEFLREGSAVEDWFETDRIVLGGNGDALDRLRAIYQNIDATIVECDITSAEMIKYASNAFLATKISFINEIAGLCSLLGADVDKVSLGVGMDKRITPAFLNAGIGYGGSCFPKDTRALDFIATINGYDFHLLRSVIDVNGRQRILPVRTLKAHFGSLAGKRIAVLGLTFKPQTDDVREAPATDIVAHLLAEGAEVVAFNPIPVATPQGAALAATLPDALAGAHAAILATEWDEICSADWRALAGSMADGAVVFDGRNALDANAVREGGARYIGVGRPESGQA